MIQILALSYRYKATPALHVDAFRLACGMHAVILGPSGCGKSTLLHLLAGILTPQTGVLQVDEVDLCGLTQRAADRWRGKSVGFLPQRLALVSSLTVVENLRLPAYAIGASVDAQRETLLLESLGLQHRRHAYPHQLSGGQRQRVAIARAVFNRPRLLLADEPTANLDDDACQAVTNLLSLQAEQAGASLVIATHDARVLKALPDAVVLRLSAPPHRRGETS